MYKDLVVPITGNAGDANALDAAVALARHMDAHLAVLELVNLPLPAPSPWGLTPDSAMSVIYTRLRDEAEARAATLRARLDKEAVSSEVRVAESLFVEPPRLAALHARHADLTVMTGGRDGGMDVEPLVHSYFSALLLEAGRPVLTVPMRYPMTVPPRHVVVAWRPRREATRALHDALPLLRAAATIDVLVVDPETGEQGDGEQPGADIGTHLARHGLRVNVVTHKRATGESVATALLRHAAQTEAGLLVAGGYGHSRFREWALGGTTRELLQAQHLPVLFSH